MDSIHNKNTEFSKGAKLFTVRRAVQEMNMERAYAIKIVTDAMRDNLQSLFTSRSDEFSAIYSKTWPGSWNAR